MTKKKIIEALKKQDFAYVVGALTDYIEQDNLPFLMQSLFDGKTAEIFPVQTGIKYQEALNIVDQTIFFQDGSTCGFNPSGDTTYTQRVLQVNPIKLPLQWCPEDLTKKFLAMYQRPGSYQENLVEEAALLDFISGLINQDMEIAYWRGDTSSGNGNLNRFDGFIKLIDAAAGVISATPQASITASNVAAIHDDIIVKLPAALMGKEVVIVEGWDTFRLLIQNLKNNNNYHYDGVNGTPYQTGELTLPGTNIRVVAVHGLNGTNRIFAGRPTNFFIGTDMENDFESAEMWYSKDAQMVRFMGKWKAGVQIAFPNEIVEYTNS